MKSFLCECAKANHPRTNAYGRDMTVKPTKAVYLRNCLYLLSFIKGQGSSTPTRWIQSKDNYLEIGKGQKSQLVDEIDRRVGNRLWNCFYDFSVDLWVRYEPEAESSSKINFPLKEKWQWVGFLHTWD